jgi:hypothetical protein
VLTGAELPIGEDKRPCELILEILALFDLPQEVTHIFIGIHPLILIHFCLIEELRIDSFGKVLMTGANALLEEEDGLSSLRVLYVGFT